MKIAINRNKEIEDRNQKGAALIIAIFAILLVTVIGFALISTGMLSQNISTNSRQQTEAYYISEAGLTHGIKLLTAASPSEFTSILQAGDGTAYTGDELSTRPTALTPIPAAGIAFGKGRYFVFISDDPAEIDGDPNADSNGQLVITSVGQGEDGATVTLEAIVKNGVSSMPGFLAAGNVKSSNDFSLLGPNATMQINGDLITSAAICAEQKIVMGTNGGTTNLGKLSSGALCNQVGQVGTTILLNQPPVAPPIIDTAKLRSSFRSKADFVFKSDGFVYRQISGVQSPIALTDTEKNSLGLGPWVLGSSTTWIYNSPIAPADGTYYFEESNTKLNHGDKLKTVKMTLLSEGSIQIDDGQAFEPSLPGYSLVAANDIAIVAELANGNLSNPGLVYAYGQLEFSNKCKIYGGVVGANFYKPDGTNGPDINDVGGKNIAKGSDGAIHIGNIVTVTTANLGSGTAGLQVTSWREVRF